MSDRRARVVAAYATVKVVDPTTGKWTVAGFQKDALLPADADPENMATLVRREYCEWVEGPVAEPEPPADDGEVDDEATDEPVKSGRPDGRSSQATWLTYAVSQRPEGMPEDEARDKYGDLTKAELIAQFGG